MDAEALAENVDRAHCVVTCGGRSHAADFHGFEA